MSDDKIAVTETMRYPADDSTEKEKEKATEKKSACFKTTRKYFISKAGEMDQLLFWAENLQAEAVTQGHVADYANCGVCLKCLGKDLWGHMNLAISASSGDRTAFDNAPPGNGFDACRRIVDPLRPRSEERLLEMHKDIIDPKPADVLPPCCTLVRTGRAR